MSSAIVHWQFEEREQPYEREDGGEKRMDVMSNTYDGEILFD